ncbi:major facilitator superfamily protein isoform X2 [Tasmannia lanceolata]|uniref:major facilitator superfamily protein isoform X2 n=1 Tax=Tasmannia lanceolata TaxID=3420 RepID=UPI0040645567
MGVVIESLVWEPNPLLYFFLFSSSLASIFLLPYFSNNSTKVDLGLVSSTIQSPFLRFQRRFLLVYSLGSVIEGLGLVLGEFEYGYYGFSREQMVVVLSVGCAAALLVGTFLGLLSDLIGHKKACMLFCILHLLVGLLKRVTKHPSIWIPSICLALASSVFSFSFESWMVAEHAKLGDMQDLLSDTFWLMTLSESASLIGSQMLANFVVGGDIENRIVSPFTAASILTMICIFCISREWNGSPPKSDIWDYKMAFSAHILSDKRIWLLAWAQGCLHFAMTIFWILWAPTIVADGREVHLAMIYPCLLGARMLGSTTVPWFLNGPLSVPVEDCLIFAFIFAGLALSIVAYDYQEIGFLVTLFCIFHACVGLILPSLARLRTKLVPNELRAGMISVSMAPANAAVLFVLIQVIDQKDGHI